MSIKCRVCPLCPVNKANNITSFQVKCFNDKRATGISVFKYFKTTLTSHDIEYLGKDGLFVNTPRMYLVTRGCSPKLFTLFTEVTDDTADLAVLIELYPSPDWKSESKKSTNKVGDGLYGSAFLLRQNCNHLVRWTLYCFWVDCLQDEMRISVACFDIPVRPTISLISETPQV